MRYCNIVFIYIFSYYYFHKSCRCLGKYSCIEQVLFFSAHVCECPKLASHCVNIIMRPANYIVTKLETSYTYYVYQNRIVVNSYEVLRRNFCPCLFQSVQSEPSVSATYRSLVLAFHESFYSATQI